MYTKVSTRDQAKKIAIMWLEEGYSVRMYRDGFWTMVEGT